jgi:alkylation response protein AidB-like acyl-CoA dehydrogenase
MDFDFAPEQYQFQQSVRGFLEQRCNLARIRGAADDDGIDVELWSGLCDLGIFAMLVPEAYGGLGLDLVDLALVLEEFGRALVPPATVETIAATDLLVRFATEAQKARWLPQILEGRLIVVPALLEAETSFDPESIALSAVASGEGWSVSGTKILAPSANRADLILVAMRFGRNGPLGLAVVEPTRRGVSLRTHANIDVVNPYHEVKFDNAPLVRSDIVGAEPTAESVWRLFDVGGLFAATLMAGIAAKVLDASVGYARQRTQFGSPIGSFQAIKHRCADMAVTVEASRSAVYYAAWALATGAPDSSRAVSIAKSYSGDMARYVCNEGIQIHGGIGFTWDLGLHYYLRRAKTLEYSYGDAAYHRERVLAMSLAQLHSEG